MYHKLGVIVPYRDRKKQLEVFLPSIREYLDGKKILYEIIVVEQKDFHDFNRGTLLNVGAKRAKELGCDYVAFHDVDMLPEEVDYSYSDYPVQIANRFFKENIREKEKQKQPYDYFGGVTIFPVSEFWRINGYSNDYFGWGFEDNDLLERCREVRTRLRTKRFRQKQGVRTGVVCSKSFFQGPRFFSEKRSFSLILTFRQKALHSSLERMSDEGAVFSVPGLDFAVAFDSFGTYKVECFDRYEDVYSVHTTKRPEMVNTVVVTWDCLKKEIQFFLNGDLVGKQQIIKGRDLYFQENIFYLGAGNPFRVGTEKWFSGTLYDFGVTNTVLGTKDVKKLQRSEQSVLLDLGDQLEAYYDFSNIRVDGTVPDLVGKQESLETFSQFEVETLNISEQFEEKVPEVRDGIFKLQVHETHGTEIGYWKSWRSRENQLRFRAVQSVGTNYMNDGLNTLGQVLDLEQESLENGVVWIKVWLNDDRKKIDKVYNEIRSMCSV